MKVLALHLIAMTKNFDQEMKEQIKENGRWVNNTDGTGIIVGIIMGDGSFAPWLNK